MPNDINAKIVLETFQKVSENVNSGFEKVYKKIDHYNDLCAQKYEECDDRVRKIEKEIAIKKALCKKKEETQKEKKDYWQSVIRAIMVASALALLAIAVKLIIFGAGL